jgi:ketopantoate reductase
MKVLAIGAGAMGTLFGTILVKAGSGHIATPYGQIMNLERMSI